ncbi:dihydrolipoyl dehydrogenase [Lachnospiraceae bacterium LCP25S3_G4]
MQEKFDLIVIGAGPGGYVAAIKAAHLGKKVGLIEARELGGTCLNRGCIPTKTLIHAVELLEQLKDSKRAGIRVEHVTYDFEIMHDRKREVVEQLKTGIQGLMKANHITVIEGKGIIEQKGIVSVKERKYYADNILIATGSKPLLPPIKGLDLDGVVTSDELLEGKGIDTKKLIIIGGGVIGVEFASIYRALGCEVTIIEAMDRILPTLDKEISQNLSMILKKKGIQIFTGARVEQVEKQDELAVSFTYKGDCQQVEGQHVLVAIGRSANTEGLCQEEIHLQMDRGRIPVDGNYKTCVEGIYAIGDVVKGGIQLAHVASAQGINAVCAMFGKEQTMNLNVIPSCIYTNPEIAAVGLSLEKAKEKGVNAKASKAMMSSNGKTVIAMGDRGFIKLVYEEDTKCLIGAQLMCERATDMIGGLADAIVNHLTIKELAATVRPHPTFCEAIGEAVEDAEGGAIHAAPKRR